ncbi:RNA-binding protein 1 isoform X2 [Harpegnathos saltator]|nr:RNA-binding protein 1 isoform X2 [Harpegnathos saltator]
MLVLDQQFHPTIFCNILKENVLTVPQLTYRTFIYTNYPSQKMSRYREWDLSCKVYVGNLGSSASKHEIESAFSKFGPLRNVWVARNPPGFAFVEFEDPRDAEDAVRGLDGTRCCGTRVRVEMSSGRSRRGGGGRRPGPRYSRSRSCSPRGKSLGHYPRSWSRSPRQSSFSRYSRSRSRSPRRRSLTRSRSRDRRSRSDSRDRR